MSDPRTQPNSGVTALEQYILKRHQQPLKGLDDIVHAIHTGTEFAAELRFSDVVEAVNSHASLKARIHDLEGVLKKEIANLEGRHPKRFLEISLSYEALLWQRLAALQPKDSAK